jgi:hypothetical protein
MRPFTFVICLLGLALSATAGEVGDALHFPAAEQLQSLGGLGEFVSVYKREYFDDDKAGDGALPTKSYRNVFIVHGGESKWYLLGGSIPLPGMQELITCSQQIPQFCSRRTTWEAYDPKSGELTIRHKPDPWVPGTWWNPAGFSMQSVLVPFEPLNWLDRDFTGVSRIEWVDWQNRAWIDERFRQLLRGKVTSLGPTTTFDLALYSMIIDDKTGTGSPADRGRRLTVTVTRKPEFKDMAVIERMDYGLDPTDNTYPGGAYDTFAYVAKPGKDGPVPVLKMAQSCTADGKVFERQVLEFFQTIDKSMHVDLCIDPGLAKKIWDDTYHLEIEPK